MSKTFAELFTELPTDLQRVVYQHLFSYCLEEIENREVCGCEYVRTVGDITDHIKTSMRYTMNECEEIIDSGVCRQCFKNYYVGYKTYQQDSCGRLFSISHYVDENQFQHDEYGCRHYDMEEISILSWEPITNDDK
jgi:hypothetical protein